MISETSIESAFSSGGVNSGFDIYRDCQVNRREFRGQFTAVCHIRGEMAGMPGNYISFSARCIIYHRGIWAATMLYTLIKMIFLQPCRFLSYAPACSMRWWDGRGWRCIVPSPTPGTVGGPEREGAGEAMECSFLPPVSEAHRTIAPIFGTVSQEYSTVLYQSVPASDRRDDVRGPSTRVASWQWPDLSR
jgi:hypothetical protein